MVWALPQELQMSQFYPGDYSGGGTVWQGARSRRQGFHNFPRCGKLYLLDSA
jgi:hypothetical protein